MSKGLAELPRKGNIMMITRSARKRFTILLVLLLATSIAVAVPSAGAHERMTLHPPEIDRVAFFEYRNNDAMYARVSWNRYQHLGRTNWCGGDLTRLADKTVWAKVSVKKDQWWGRWWEGSWQELKYTTAKRESGNFKFEGRDREYARSHNGSGNVIQPDTKYRFRVTLKCGEGGKPTSWSRHFVATSPR